MGVRATIFFFFFFTNVHGSSSASWEPRAAASASLRVGTPLVCRDFKETGENAGNRGIMKEAGRPQGGCEVSVSAGGDTDQLTPIT